ncbi:contactin-4-like, partial [Pecten maximus]|uniref:contactin-4-like n=1 Tax=Pecten maximus TaxID=6579 RepID=UPI0014590523
GPFIRLNQSEVVLEGESLTRTCSAYGNPKPTTFWYHDGNALGTKKTLQFLSIDRQDAGNYTCIATATHDNVSLRSSKALNIIVQYGPDVDLSITNATENRTNLRLNCTANGVPTKYTYRWTHKIGSTVIRDSFDHVTNLGSMSTLTIPTVSLQDMGMYICEVENGIPGRNGQIVQTGQGIYVSIPRIIRAQDRYVTENGTSLSINITFISFPEPVNTSIIRTDSSLPPQDDPTVSISPVPVSVSFYNKDVTVDGYMAQIHFSKVETTQKGQYQLYIKNAFDYFYTFRVVIIGKPDPPSNLVISQITENSAVISWIPGEDNGHIQTFTLTYRKSSGELQTNFTTSKSSLNVRNLTMSTRYDVSVYASNLEGTSEIITGNFRTTAALGRQSNNTNTGLVLISIGSVMILIALLIGAFPALRSGRLSCQRTATQSVTQQQPAEVELQTASQGN